MEFRVLGPLEIWDDGWKLELSARMQRVLLGVLLQHAYEVVPVGRLVDELWGERPPATAAELVQGYVAALRKALGADLIATHGSGYVLVVGPGQLDALEFERLVGEAQVLCRPIRRPGGCVRRWCCGVGPAADEGLNDRRLDAIAARIDADLACGRDDGLVGELEALVADHPYREKLRA
jgi:DNA-binding SARP family transcriptional activator